MPVDSLPNLVDLVRRLQLLPMDQLAELNASLQTKFPEPRALAGELVRRGWLTPYQINQIFLDRGAGLVLGSYVVLERLGEGGMGAVFKARHQKLGRIVAVKLIRKDRLAHPDAVRRFYREVQAAAALEHPHIVRSYDAGESGGAYFFVMEHVEGTDLALLVKQHGPLSLERACDYARQAALGLQHAFERGMVHRDIKPANLLLATKGDIVKVLDMGLARLDRADADAGLSTTLTQEGAVMGTPDYIAPEQARDSHTADIRADLYSLGCTLYVLLTGRVPFPGGSLTEKLLKHQMDEPRPVEQLRPETPPAVAAVVRKLMAKRPNDRYQTPAEAAEALASASIAPAASVTSQTLAEGMAVNPSPAPRTDSDTLETGATAEVVRRAVERRRRQAVQGWRRLAVYTVGGFLSLGLGVWLLTLVLRFALPPAPVSPPVAQPALSSAVEEWCKRVAALPVEEQVKAVAEELKKRNPGFDGAVTPTIENGVVVALELPTDAVTDIAPVRALGGLRKLNCSGNQNKGRLADLSPLKDTKLTTFWCNNTPVADLSPLKDMKLTFLSCGNTQVSDLSPLKDMPLTELHCERTMASDLSPLKGMKLTALICNHTKVADLSPLKQMPLAQLYVGETLASDLSPLKDMKLVWLDCHGTSVSNLSPLNNLPLTWLNCSNTRISDLSLLKEMPLRDLNCDFRPERDADLLRSIPTLRTINDKPAADFWKEVDAQRAEFDAWCKQVAAMKPDAQVEAVKVELKKRNPKFDGKVTSRVENDEVVELELLTEEVTDIAPVRALTRLQTLNCGCTWADARLADLSPLKGMKLIHLSCLRTKVSDLSPLKGMRLTSLDCGGTPVSDLSPLKDMRLTALWCQVTPVSDLSPLKDMKLTTLDVGYTHITDLSPLKDMKLIALSCNNTPVSDLSPLRDMKLVNMDCVGTAVSDLSPLKDMPLQKLHCDFNVKRDAELLRSITTLTLINNKPASDFWKEVDSQRAEFDAWCKQVVAMTPDEQVKAVADALKKCNPGFDGQVKSDVKDGAVVALEFDATETTDISPLRALGKLSRLTCAGSNDWNKPRAKLSDLSPLKGLPLNSLNCSHTSVTTLEALRGLPLNQLNFSMTAVSDLSPLKDMKLIVLGCVKTPVADLAPLKNMPLTQVQADGTNISDLSPLKDMKLIHLHFGGAKVQDLTPLKAMKLSTLGCENTPISDLSPLKDMKLTALWCNGTNVTDLSPLKDMPLQNLKCDFRPERDADLLRAIPTLMYINDKLAADFWKQVGVPGPKKP